MEQPNRFQRLVAAAKKGTSRRFRPNDAALELGCVAATLIDLAEDDAEERIWPQDQRTTVRIAKRAQAPSKIVPNDRSSNDPVNARRRQTSALCSEPGWVVFRSFAGEGGRAQYAPLAQLAEQVTLNQRGYRENLVVLPNMLPIRLPNN